MMSEELDILKIVAENPSVSQRKISDKTGISLGQVNFLIKKFVKKGLIKIEGQTTKSIKYNLTPRGFAEKAALTMEYIKISCNAVITLTDNIKAIVFKYQSDGYKIYFPEAQDEIMDLVRLAIGEVKSITEYTTEEKAILLYWDEETIKGVSEISGIKFINILR